MEIKLSPKTVLKRLGLFILFLLCANILGIISRLYLGSGNIFGLVTLFDFDTERNIPTLYSSITLVIAGTLLLFIALKHKVEGISFLPWIGLAIIFLFLSVDEISSIHERLARPTRELLNTEGFLFGSWVLSYVVALVVFVVSYTRFLFRLPRNIMVLFLFSGAIFVAGAIGFELAGGRHSLLFSKEDLVYSLFYSCEELFEMLGIALFIYTLLTYIVSEYDAMRITVSRA